MKHDTNDTNSVFTVLHHKVGNYNMNKIDDAVNLDYFSLSKVIGSWIRMRQPLKPQIPPLKTC